MEAENVMKNEGGTAAAESAAGRAECQVFVIVLLVTSAHLAFGLSFLFVHLLAL